MKINLNKMVSMNRQFERLFKYQRSLRRLKALGNVKVYSDVLANLIGVKPTQVRKDFSIFGINGNKKGGYEIEDVLLQIDSLLGKNSRRKAILVGYGKLGRALVEFGGFGVEAIDIVCCFDNSPDKYNIKDSVPVLPVENMLPYIRQNKIKVAIMAVPRMEAQNTLNVLVFAGIRGVLNFSSEELIVPDGCFIRNVNLVDEMQLIYYAIAGEDSNEAIEKEKISRQVLFF